MNPISDVTLNVPMVALRFPTLPTTTRQLEHAAIADENRHDRSRSPDQSPQPLADADASMPENLDISEALSRIIDDSDRRIHHETFEGREALLAQGYESRVGALRNQFNYEYAEELQFMQRRQEERQQVVGLEATEWMVNMQSAANQELNYSTTRMQTELAEMQQHILNEHPNTQQLVLQVAEAHRVEYDVHLQRSLAEFTTLEAERVETFERNISAQVARDKLASQLEMQENIQRIVAEANQQSGSVRAQCETEVLNAHTCAKGEQQACVLQIAETITYARREEMR